MRCALITTASVASLALADSNVRLITPPDVVKTLVENGRPRCTYPYDTLFETPCFKVVDKAGPVVIREYSSGVQFPQDVIFAGCTSRERDGFDVALSDCGAGESAALAGERAPCCRLSASPHLPLSPPLLPLSPLLPRAVRQP